MLECVCLKSAKFDICVEGSALLTCQTLLHVIFREEVRKIESSSASCDGGGKKRIDAGAGTGDSAPETGNGAPAKLQEGKYNMDISSAEAEEHFNY